MREAELKLKRKVCYVDFKNSLILEKNILKVNFSIILYLFKNLNFIVIYTLISTILINLIISLINSIIYFLIEIFLLFYKTEYKYLIYIALLFYINFFLKNIVHFVLPHVCWIIFLFLIKVTKIEYKTDGYKEFVNF